MLAQPSASRPRDRHLIGIATAALAVVFIGLLLGQGQPSVPGPSTSFPIESRSVPSESGAAVATQTPEEWDALALAPYEPIAQLTATRADASGLARRAAFTLRSLTSVPAATLAAGITTNPALTLDVMPGRTADVVTLRPRTPLTPGARYRFRLAAPDGSLAGAWAFRVAGPLHVTGLLPRDHTTGVPVSTGIEVTFDQDSPTDFAAHFSITPATDGRFEVHDRTWVFVPKTPLKPGTLYTYTVHAGVAMSGSTQKLEADVRASFETASSDPREAQVRFDRGVFEARTATLPLVGIWTSTGEDGAPAIKTLPTEIYRLPTLELAAEVARRFGSQDDWLTTSSAGLYPTAGLTRVATFSARLTDRVEGWYVLHVPTTLDPGWYLIVVPRHGRDAQAIIQVTDLATYALSSTTRTVVWLNDMATGSPVPGAAVRVAGGESLGRTDADGVLDAATPAALRTQVGGDDYYSARAHVLTIRAADGRGVLAPLGMPSDGHYPWNGPYSGAVPTPWWAILDADRSTYRTTDTIHAWGFIRTRTDRTVPADLELRLTTPGGNASQPIAKVALTPTARGTFVADIALRDVPTGDGYELQLYAGNRLVSARWLSVGVIRKPAYSIAISTDRRAYLAGDTIKVTAAARFFDGTTSPGLVLNAGIWNWNDDKLDRTQQVTTDALGAVSASSPAVAEGPEGWTETSIVIVPRNPEEGEIRGEDRVFVFPSAIWLAADASVRDGRLRLAGSVSSVDLARLDRELAQTGWPQDPAGAPAADKSLSIQVIHIIPIKHLVRTDYDYVEKRAVPIYEYDEREETLGTYTVRSGSDGRFSLSVPVPNPAHSYRAVVRTRDAKDRLSQVTVTAWQPYAWPGAPNLHLDGPDTASIGQSVAVTVRATDQSVPAGRFLFLVGRDGIRDVVVTSDARLTRVFGERDLPGYTVRAIRLSEIGLEDAGSLSVSVVLDEKRVRVTLTPDREHYQPGDTVTVAIRTNDPEGRPMAADVVLRATDEKLFSIDTAHDSETLAELMAFVDPGFLQSYTAEFAPRSLPEGGGMGGAGGGDGRGDFRDSLTFQLVSTDAQGRATASFALSDDLTSWHLSASALTANLDAGDGSIIIPVGLPFFVEATLSPDYLAGEQPVLRLRAYGDGIRIGDPVRFTVSAPSLGISSTTVDGRAFEAVRVPLPALPAGDHRIAIDGLRIGDATLHDRLIRTIHVIPNRLTMLRTSYHDLAGQLSPPTGVAMTTYLVTDAGRGALVPILQELAGGGGARFDRLAAAEAARNLLAETFGLPLAGLAPTGFDPARYQNGDGIAILPYASADLALAAEAALVVPDQIDRNELRNAVRWALDPERDEPVTREQAIIAYTALAALGDDVLDELHKLATSGQAPGERERLWLALGYLASGDEAAAREIERAMLEARGRQLGPWVRLDAGSWSAEANGLMLLLSAGLGDPVAGKISRYLADHPSRERAYALEQLGYARAMLDRLPRAAGSFAWSVDGQRHVETLTPGSSFTVSLTPDQQRSLSFERLAGALLVTTTAVDTATPADLPNDPNITISRKISPAGSAAEDEVVHVTITVSMKRIEGSGCYTVTDLVPSGLAPIATTANWPGDESDVQSGAIRPYLVDGQRVSWCLDPSVGSSRPLVYSARVVSPGTYVWEPAVVQFDSVPSVGASTATTSYTIR